MKRHKTAEWIKKKKRSRDMLATKGWLHTNDTHGLRVKGWKNVVLGNGNKKSKGDCIYYHIK